MEEEGKEGLKLGIKRYKDAVYVGQIDHKGKRHGKGLMLYINGRKYEGDWNNDVRHGRGFERHLNNNTYLGEFRDGKAHGHGLYKWGNEEEYDG